MTKSHLVFYLKKLAFLLICTFFLLLYYFSSRDIGRAKALLYPKFIMVIFGIILLWNIIGTILEARKEITEKINQSQGENIEKSFWQRNQKSIVIFISAILYIFIGGILGFWVTTLLYISFLFYYLGIKKFPNLIFQSIIITAILYSIFKLWLKLALPEGLLF
ncbi:MAG: hypothetical protein Kow00103_10870 [Candidatus Caldatribacteriota bacterium]